MLPPFCQSVYMLISICLSISKVIPPDSWQLFWLFRHPSNNVCIVVTECFIRKLNFARLLYLKDTTFEYLRSFNCDLTRFIRNEIKKPLSTISFLVNPIVPNAPFLCPRKTSENRHVFWWLSGVRERVHWERMG